MPTQQMLLSQREFGDGITRWKVTPDNTTGNSYIDLGADLITPNYLQYTVEVWCRPLTTPSGQCWVIDQHPTGSGRTFFGANGANGYLAWFSGNMYTTTTVFGSPSDWAHLAFVANGDGTVTIFKDGVSAGTSGSLITAAPPSQNTLWGQDTTYGSFNCEYRGFRFNTNKVYTSNFTPPSINGGLTDIAGTVGLWTGLTGSATDASGTNTWSATNMTFTSFVT